MRGRASETVLSTGVGVGRLKFPLSTKNRKGWGTQAETHVYNIAI